MREFHSFSAISSLLFIFLVYHFSSAHHYDESVCFANYFAIEKFGEFSENALRGWVRERETVHGRINSMKKVVCVGKIA